MLIVSVLPPTGKGPTLKNLFKTGTAENPHGENHSWFIGVAPLESPEIVVAVIIENSGHGSEIAAPMVGKIIESFMKKRSEINDFMLADESESKGEDD